MKLQQLDNEGKPTDVVRSFGEQHALNILAVKNSKWIKFEEEIKPPKKKREKKQID